MSAVDLQDGPAGKNDQVRAFSCIGNLLGSHGRLTPQRDAILAPGRPSMTYGALWAWTNHTLRQLRKIGVGRSDRVSVVLPQGPDAAVATLGVSASAVCVPLNSSFTADESRRYFGELGIAALVTRPNVDTASRDVAGMLGIPVIDLWCSPKERSGECSVLGR